MVEPNLSVVRLQDESVARYCHFSDARIGGPIGAVDANDIGDDRSHMGAHAGESPGIELLDKGQEGRVCSLVHVTCSLETESVSPCRRHSPIFGAEKPFGLGVDLLADIVNVSGLDGLLSFELREVLVIVPVGVLLEGPKGGEDDCELTAADPNGVHHAILVR